MNYRSVLILVALFVDQFRCQESASCQIMSMTKHSDSSCNFGLDKSAEEEGYISKLNNMIESGNCDQIDPIQNDQIKLKVDCQSSSSVKFRFYNHFGDDETCSKEKSKLGFDQKQTLIALDGACSRMSEDIYYKFSIAPQDASRRQTQAVVVVPGGLATVPQQQFVLPQQRFAAPQQQFFAPQQQYFAPQQAYQPVVYAPAQVAQVQQQSPFATSTGQTVGQFVANQVDRGIQGIGSALNNIFDPSGRQFQQQSLFPPLLFTRPLLLNQQQQQEINSVNKSSALSTAAIIGIIGGGVCLVFLCIASFCYFLRGSKQGNVREMEMNQMGNMQQGPNFNAGEVTDTEEQPNYDQTETHGQTNQKQGDSTYGNYLQNY